MNDPNNAGPTSYPGACPAQEQPTQGVASLRDAANGRDQNAIVRDSATSFGHADDAAATALQKLHDDPALRAEIGAKAKRFIADYFSVANFKADVERFLDAPDNEQP